MNDFFQEFITKEEVEKDTPATEQDQTTQTTEQINNTQEQEEPKEYVPNYTYKVGEEEKQFNEIFKDIVKNPENEKVLRDLYTRADKYNQSQPQLNELLDYSISLQEKYNYAHDQITQVQQLINNNNIPKLLEYLKIPEESIHKFVRDQIIYHQADPQTKAQIEQSREMQNSYSNIQAENQKLKEREQMRIQYEFNSALSSPEVKQIGQLYDQKYNQPGAFREFIRTLALQELNTTGIQPNFYTLVNKAISMVTPPNYQQQGGQPPPQQNQQQTNQQAGDWQQQQNYQQNLQNNNWQQPPPNYQQNQQNNNWQQPPPNQYQQQSMPSFKGNSSQQPIVKEFKSTDELRKHASTL